MEERLAKLYDYLQKTQPDSNWGTLEQFSEKIGENPATRNKLYEHLVETDPDSNWGTAEEFGNQLETRSYWTQAWDFTKAAFEEGSLRGQLGSELPTFTADAGLRDFSFNKEELDRQADLFKRFEETSAITSQDVGSGDDGMIWEALETVGNAFSEVAKSLTATIVDTANTPGETAAAFGTGAVAGGAAASAIAGTVAATGVGAPVAAVIEGVSSVGLGLSTAYGASAADVGSALEFHSRLRKYANEKGLDITKSSDLAKIYKDREFLDVALRASNIKGGIEGTVESVVGMIAPGAGKVLGSRLAKATPLSRVLSRKVAEVAVEGVGGGTGAVAGSAASKAFAGDDIKASELWGEFVEEFTVEAIVGGTLGAAGRAVDNNVVDRTFKRKQTETRNNIVDAAIKGDKEGYVQGVQIAVDQGVIQQEEADYLTTEYDRVAGTLQSVPEDVINNPTDRREIIKRVLDRESMDRQIQDLESQKTVLADDKMKAVKDREIKRLKNRKAVNDSEISFLTDQAIVKQETPVDVAVEPTTEPVVDSTTESEVQAMFEGESDLVSQPETPVEQETVKQEVAPQETVEQEVAPQETVEQTQPDEFASSTDRSSLDGQQVRYKGEVGTLEVTEDAVTFNGELIETALNPEVTNQQLGIEQVVEVPQPATPQTVEQPTPQEVTPAPQTVEQPTPEAVEQSTTSEFTVEEAAEFEIALSQEEQTNLESELAEAAREISAEINKNPVFQEITNSFTDPFDEGLSDRSDSFGNRRNASQLAKALLDGRIPKKVKEQFPEGYLDGLKVKAAQLRKAAGANTPTNKRKVRTQALKTARKRSEEALMERAYPGITKTKNMVQAQAERLSKFLPDVKIEIPNRPEDFADIVKDLTKSKSRKPFLEFRGMYDTNSDTVYINPHKASPTTVAHEVSHALFSRFFGEKSQDALLIHNSIREVLANGNRLERDLGRKLQEFVDGYNENKYTQAEEFFAELLATMSENSMRIRKPRMRKIKQAINDIIFGFTGLKLFDETSTDVGDVIDFVNTLSGNMSKGQLNVISNNLDLDGPTLVQEQVLSTNSEVFAAQEPVNQTYGQTIQLTLPIGTTVDKVSSRDDVKSSEADVVVIEDESGAVEYVPQGVTSIEEAVEANNGNPLKKSANGSPSLLYDELLTLTGSHQMAERFKTTIYTKKFKDWFEGSEAVDANGEPTLVDGLYVNTKTGGVRGFQELGGFKFQRPQRYKTKRENFFENFEKGRETFTKNNPNPIDFYRKHKGDFDARGVTMFDIIKLYKGLDPRKNRIQVLKESEARKVEIDSVLKEAGLSNKKRKAVQSLYDNVAKRWAKRTGRTEPEFWSDIIERFEFKDVSDDRTPLQQAKDGLTSGDRGATILTDENKAIIFITSDSTVATPVHELAHVYEIFMSADEKKTVMDWAGVETWNVDASEAFARGFESFLASDLKFGDKRLQKIFKNFRKWLYDIYRGLANIDAPALSPKMKELYNDIFMAGTPFQDNNPRTEFKKREKLQPTRKNLRQIAQSMGLQDVPNSFVKTSESGILKNVEMHGFDTPEVAAASVERAVAEIARREKAGLTIGTGLTTEETLGVFSVLRDMQGMRDNVAMALSEARDNSAPPNQIKEYVDILNDLENELFTYQRVVNTSASSAGLALRALQIHMGKSDSFTQEDANKFIAEWKELDSRSFDESKIREAYRKMELSSRSFSKASRELQEKSQESAQQRAERIRKGDNKILKAAREAFKNFTPEQVRQKYVESLKTLNKHFSTRFDSVNVNDPFQAQVEFLVAAELLYGDSRSIDELYESIRSDVRYSDITSQITKDRLVDAILRNQRDADSTRVQLESADKSLRREAQLLGQLSDLFINALPTKKRVNVQVNSKDFVKIKEIHRKMVTSLAGATDSQLNPIDVTFITQELNSLVTSYEGLLLDRREDGQTGLGDVTEQDVVRMLQRLDMIESRRYLVKLYKDGETTPDEQVSYVDKLYNEEGFLDQEVAKLGVDPSGLTLSQVRNSVLNKRRTERMEAKSKEIQSDIQSIFDVFESDKTHEEKMSAYNAAAHKYNIGNKKPDKIESEDFQRAKAKYDRDKRAFTKFIHKARESSFKRKLKKVINTPKVLTLAFDYSVVTYQAAIAGMMHPMVAGKLLPQMVYASFKKDYFQRSMQNLEQRPSFYLAQLSGLEVRGDSSTLFDEETQWNTIFDDWGPVGEVTKGIQAFSNRSYSFYMEHLRMHMFEEYAKGVTQQSELNDIAETINTITGAAQKFGGERFTRGVSALLEVAKYPLIAPRLYASSFKNIIGMAYHFTAGRLDPRKREIGQKRIAQMYRRAATGQLGYVAAGFLVNLMLQAFDSDNDDENDFLTPFHSDFGRIKHNQLRVTWSPFVSYMDAIVKTAGKVANLSGLIETPENASQTWKQSSPVEVMYDEFIKYRYNPLISSFERLAYNQDFLGNQIPEDTKSQVTKRYLPTILPIFFAGVTQNFVEGKPATQTGLQGALDFSGFGSFYKDLHWNQTVQDYYESVKYRGRIKYPKEWENGDYRRDLLRNEVRKKVAEYLVNQLESGKEPKLWELKQQKAQAIQEVVPKID